MIDGASIYRFINNFVNLNYNFIKKKQVEGGYMEPNPPRDINSFYRIAPKVQGENEEKIGSANEREDDGAVALIAAKHLGGILKGSTQAFKAQSPQYAQVILENDEKGLAYLKKSIQQIHPNWKVNFNPVDANRTQVIITKTNPAEVMPAAPPKVDPTIKAAKELPTVLSDLQRQFESGGESVKILVNHLSPDERLELRAMILEINDDWEIPKIFETHQDGMDPKDISTFMVVNNKSARDIQADYIQNKVHAPFKLVTDTINDHPQQKNFTFDVTQHSDEVRSRLKQIVEERYPPEKWKVNIRHEQTYFNAPDDIFLDITRKS